MSQPKEPMFPIMNDDIIKALPWSVMRPHEQQAQRNHSQTLNRLSQRGGLDITEAYCILKDMSYPRGKFNLDAVRIALMKMVADFNVAAVPAPTDTAVQS